MEKFCFKHLKLKRFCVCDCAKIFVQSVFPLSRFFSANRQFVGARANKFWQCSKRSFRKFDKFVDIWHLVCFNTGLVQNLGHINVFLKLWAYLFQENLGTTRLAIKLEGIQSTIEFLLAFLLHILSGLWPTTYLFICLYHIYKNCTYYVTIFCVLLYFVVAFILLSSNCDKTILVICTNDYEILYIFSSLSTF